MGNLKPIKELFDFEKGQLQSSKSTEGKYAFITAAKEWKTHGSFTHDCEALIFAAAASGSLGRTHYYNGKFIASDLCFVLTPKEKYKNLIDLKFYHTIFNSSKEDIVKQTSTGTSKVSINKTNFGNYEIPLFGIEQQNSIKKKLEFSQPKKNALDVELQTQSELIKKLRSSFFRDAVSGKLVPQDPNDENAEVLLGKIKAEKEKFIKEGKIKKQKPLPPISEDEMPYELPDGWVWCRLSNVCKNIHYGYTASAEQTCDEPKMLRITDIQNNSVNWQRVPHCKISDEEMEKYLLKERDILVARTGGTVGKSFLMTNVPVKCVFASYLIRLIPSNFINEQYLKLILESPLYWKQIIAKSMGTGQPNVNGTSLGELVMSFPPLEEQNRIVEKVGKLMATCDALELEVQNSKTETEKLMQSVLKEAFEN